MDNGGVGVGYTTPAQTGFFLNDPQACVLLPTSWQPLLSWLSWNSTMCVLMLTVLLQFCSPAILHQLCALYHVQLALCTVHFLCVVSLEGSIVVLLFCILGFMFLYRVLCNKFVIYCILTPILIEKGLRFIIAKKSNKWQCTWLFTSQTIIVIPGYFIILIFLCLNYKSYPVYTLAHSPCMRCEKWC